LAAASGDFVLFLDDDDLLDPTTVETAVQCLSAGTQADVAVCCGQFFGNLDVLPLGPFFLDPSGPPPRWIAALVGASRRQRDELQANPIRTLLKGGGAPIHAFVVRRRAIGETRFAEDLESGEDWVFWIDLAIKGCQFRFNSLGRVYVRRHAGNSPATASGFVACERVLEMVENRGHEEAFLAAARTAVFSWHGGSLEWRRVATSLARYPIPLVKYGGQFLARRAYQRWKRAKTMSRPTSDARLIPGKTSPRTFDHVDQAQGRLPPGQ
jgi:glycosyltransferase involved in cell wall biosynthesis